MDVGIGVDSHKRTIAAAAVNALGSVLSVREFQNCPKGHIEFLQWARCREGTRRIGIECSGTYGSPLASLLLEAGEDTREVPTPLAFRERRRQRSEGKSDTVDAVAIARIVARDDELPSPKRTQQLSDLKLLCDYHDQLIHARTRVTNRVHIDLVVLRPGYSDKIPNLRAKKHLASVHILLHGDHSVRASLVKARLTEIKTLNKQISEVDDQIAERITAAKTTLTEIPGVGPFLAAKILGEVGEFSRIKSKAAFASMSGTAPIVASSGATKRHRLNRAGNRQLNWALHYIALAQCRVSPEAKAYMTRKKESGQTYKEAIRCLKRHLSNVVYRHLMRDAQGANMAT